MKQREKRQQGHEELQIGIGEKNVQQENPDKGGVGATGREGRLRHEKEENKIIVSEIESLS